MANSTKNIEIEVRGLLPNDTYPRVKAFLDEHGEHIGHQERLFVDYSTFLPGAVRDRQKDIRIRITNGKPEIIVKIGGWGGSDSRKELSVFSEAGSFDTLADIFAALGYTKGVLCIRNRDNYLYKGVEFALIEVPGHSYYFEAEKMADDGEDTAALTQEINTVCAELGLTTFTDEEFFAYIEVLNENANAIYDHAEHGSGYFKKTYGL